MPLKVTAKVKNGALKPYSRRLTALQKEVFLNWLVTVHPKLYNTFNWGDTKTKTKLVFEWVE